MMEVLKKGNPIVFTDITTPLNVTGNKTMKIDNNDEIWQIADVDNTKTSYDLGLTMKSESTTSNAVITMDWLNNAQNSINKCVYNQNVNNIYTRYKFSCSIPGSAKYIKISVSSNNLLSVDDLDLVCTT
jgi:hypothetical protein